jgi:hypothetical protein
MTSSIITVVLTMTVLLAICSNNSQQHGICRMNLAQMPLDKLAFDQCP